MKKISLILLFLAMLSLTSCNSSSPDADNSVPESNVSIQSETSNSNQTKFDIAKQEYSEFRNVEIINISSDNETDSIKSINNDIDQKITKIYDDVIAENNNDVGFDILVYPFADENYLQLVYTSLVFPNYATDGDIYSFNYNIKQDKYIKLDDIFSELNTTEDAIKSEIKPLYTPEYEGISLTDIDICGFLYKDNDIILLLNLSIDSTIAEPCTLFYSYTVNSKTLNKLDRANLFSPNDLVKFDPPIMAHWSEHMNSDFSDSNNSSTEEIKTEDASNR